MKLLYCLSCGDLFNLQLTLKSCSCGKVKGMYTSRVEAQVNGEGFSIAVGNGSLDRAIYAARELKEDPRGSGDAWRHSTTIMCWARPHSGPANPHTFINPSLGKEEA